MIFSYVLIHMIYRKTMGLQNFGVIIMHLSLGLCRNVTQRDGEYGGISKQALVVTEAPSVRGVTEIVC